MTSHPSLITLSFETTESQASFFLETLDPFCLSLSCFENIENPLKWTVEALLEDSEEMHHLFMSALENISQSQQYEIPKIKVTSVPSKNWVLETYQAFPPLMIGPFYIHGSHTTDACPEGLIPLQINAATAFGSGEHATTKGCLMLLYDLWILKKVSSDPPLSFLDVGTGSGILAFAMAGLFKTRVIALDNDPESIRVTNENTHLNNLSDKIETYLSEGFDILKKRNAPPFSVIMANILKDPLLEMAEDMGFYTQKNGYIILSGLLTTQALEVIKHYEKAGFKFLKSYEEKEWSALLLQKST
ncbi:MAG: 50S ribosomal protein L11 methyltransferase [Proteobacteria bacterium]|nr:50S ribosomal protein L11 methyltransferase [Pseudomonadota bacterium]